MIHIYRKKLYHCMVIPVHIEVIDLEASYVLFQEPFNHVATRNVHSLMQDSSITSCCVQGPNLSMLLLAAKAYAEFYGRNSMNNIAEYFSHCAVFLLILLMVRSISVTTISMSPWDGSTVVQGNYVHPRFLMPLFGQNGGSNLSRP